MTRLSRFAPSYIAIGLALAPILGAQSSESIARRVAAGEGEIRMTYAARPDACGDGKDVVAVGRALNISTSVETYGSWSGVNCVPGPARVSLTVRDGDVVGIRTHIGGAWSSREGRVVDLGRVSAAEASAYFLSLVPKIGAKSRANPLLAAALADSVRLAPDMLRIARATTLPRETRRRAVHWAGVLGDASTVGPLTELAEAGEANAREDSEDVGPGDGLQGAAVGALSMIRDGGGMPALLEMARRGSPTLRKAAVFWLGRRDEPQGRALVRAIASDANESEQLRGAAIFALGQSDKSSSANGTFVRELFPNLTSERLKDRVFMAVAQRESGDDGQWLLAQARDARQPIEVRRKAVFWAGQGHARIADIVALYRSSSEATLREHVIFVLSQRDEKSAVDALISIARSDADREMRSKALFWLGQKDDPRVTALISELVNR